MSGSACSPSPSRSLLALRAPPPNQHRSSSSAALRLAAAVRRRNGGSAREADRRLGLGARRRQDHDRVSGPHDARDVQPQAHGRRALPASEAGGPFELTFVPETQRSMSTTCSSATCGSRRANRTWSSQSSQGNNAAQRDRRRERFADSPIQGARLVVERSGRRSRRRRVDAGRPAARRRFHGGRILLRARAAKVDRRSDRDHQYHMGRQQHRDMDEPRRTALSDSAWAAISRAEDDATSRRVRDSSREVRSFPTKDPGW